MNLTELVINDAFRIDSIDESKWKDPKTDPPKIKSNIKPPHDNTIIVGLLISFSDKNEVVFQTGMCMFNMFAEDQTKPYFYCFGQPLEIHNHVIRYIDLEDLLFKVK